MQGETHGEQSRYKITADKFEISEIRFEDQGMILCRAENLFGDREAGVKLIVFGKFFSIVIKLLRILSRFLFLLVFVAKTIISGPYKNTTS